VILTLARRCDATHRVKDSRFFACAFPANSEDEAGQGIDTARKEHPDATHCCYAYRIGAGDAVVERVSDAGEPAGSAGAPILSVIRGRRLTNVAVAVARHFGGTKLGIGGLVRAYRDAARAAVEAGEIQERQIRRRLTVWVPLTLVGETLGLLARLNGVLLSESYGDCAELQVAIGEELEADFRSRLNDLTRGATRWAG